MAKPTSSTPGCVAAGLRLAWALSVFTGLLGVLPQRQPNPKSSKR